MRVIYWLFIVNFLLLTWVGGQAVEEPYIMIGRILTIFYFSYFVVILPIMGYLEDILAYMETTTSKGPKSKWLNSIPTIKEKKKGYDYKVLGVLALGMVIYGTLAKLSDNSIEGQGFIRDVSFSLLTYSSTLAIIGSILCIIKKENIEWLKKHLKDNFKAYLFYSLISAFLI